MTDIATIWVPSVGRGDWTIAGGDLAPGDDLVTAVLISLFTDRLAHADDAIPDGTSDRRGWWGDDPAIPIGSRLWLLDRAKQTQETLGRAHDYIVEALEWLIGDGIAAAIDVTTEWTRPSLLGATVIIHRATGPQRALQFAWAWTQIAAE